MAHITGNLKDILKVAQSGAQLVVTLCGYGGLMPRIPGTGVICKTTPEAIDSADGTYDFNLYGNDLILPGPNQTFYTVQFKDDQGNVIQTAAFQFVDANAYDLAAATPYSPPAPPISPLLNGLLVVVPYSANPVFPAGSAGVTTFVILLTGDVVGSTITGIVPGALYNFVISQDGVGGHGLVWPANVKGGAPANLLGANMKLAQSFAASNDGNLYAISPGVIF